MRFFLVVGSEQVQKFGETDYAVPILIEANHDENQQLLTKIGPVFDEKFPQLLDSESPFPIHVYLVIEVYWIRLLITHYRVAILIYDLYQLKFTFQSNLRRGFFGQNIHRYFEPTPLRNEFSL